MNWYTMEKVGGLVARAAFMAGIGGSSMFGCHSAFVPAISCVRIGNSKVGGRGGLAPRMGKIPKAELASLRATTELPGLSDKEMGMLSDMGISMDGVKETLSGIPSINDVKDRVDDVKDKLASIPSVDDVKDGLDKLASGQNPLTLKPPLPLKPSPPPPFDPTSPEVLISTTKSFIATDFGIQGSQLQDYSTAQKAPSTATEEEVAAEALAAARPFYSSSLLSDAFFVWASENNLNDGTGLLTKREYLAAGRFFALRRSFPDLEYRAHDFRVEEEGEEITVRFTTLVTGTFRGAPLRLRSTTLEPNGKEMKCPPTSVSVTYSTVGADRGKIVKLVTDVVLDRLVGNTSGLSGVAGAAVVAGAPSNSLSGVPPLVALERFFGRPPSPPEDLNVGKRMAPFPDSVLVQLAKGVIAAGFGRDDPNLLAREFVYLEPLVGPMDKEGYLAFSGEYDLSGAVPDLDYGLQNFRVDPYDPYRVWVDTRATGTRISSIGKSALPLDVQFARYEAPPEAMSFTFDDDGFCTRFTAAAVMDPLLGNTGGLGGVYGLLYATGTPASPLRTRSPGAFLSRVSKSLASGLTGVDADGWRLSDGRVLNGLMQSKAPLAEAAPPPKSLPKAPTLPARPFFAVEAEAVKEAPQPEIPLPNAAAPTAAGEVAAANPPPPPTPPKEQAPATAAAETTPRLPPISPNPADPVTEALNNALDAWSALPAKVAAPPTKVAAPPAADREVGRKARELRLAAAAARAEAAEAKRKAGLKRAEEAAKRTREAAQRQAASDARTRAQTAKTAAREEAAKAREAAAAKKVLEFAEKQATFEAKKKARLAEVAAAREKAAKQAAEAKDRAAARRLREAAEKQAALKAKKKALAAAKVKAAKRSPTIRLKGTTLLPPKVQAAPKSAAKGAAAKRSNTISLFGLSSPRKTSPKTLSRKSPTLNVIGVGGAPGKKRSTPAKSRAPWSSFFARAPTEKVSAKGKSPAKLAAGATRAKSRPTSPFFARAPTEKAPAKMTSPAKPVAGAIRAKSRPALSLFGGGATRWGAALEPPRRAPSVVTSTRPVKEAPRPANGKGNPFGGFFTGGARESKGNVASSAPPALTGGGSKPTPAPNKSVVQPKGVSVLKQWKQAKDNAVEGRIFGSSSFKEGTTVTTSSISVGKITKGSVVQTRSGSKYFLE